MKNKDKLMGKKAISVLAYALAVSALGCLQAKADDFSISYSGTDAGFGFASSATGAGSFSVDSLGDLTAFSLTIDQVCAPGNCSGPETDVFTYGLVDITGFSVTENAGIVSALSFSTDYQPGFYTPDTEFILTDLGTGDASTYNFDTGPITVGTLTVTPAIAATPEPSTLSLLGLGLAAALGLQMRKRSGLGRTA
jgi:hypothetical protein